MRTPTRTGPTEGQIASMNGRTPGPAGAGAHADTCVLRLRGGRRVAPGHLTVGDRTPRGPETAPCPGAPYGCGSNRRNTAVLTPGPQDLRVALARYADARIEDARRSTDVTVRAVEDAAYTLCVMTGTQAVTQALDVADTMLGMRAGVSPVLRRSAGTQQDDNTLLTA